MSIGNELRLQRGTAATCFERIVAAAREEVEDVIEREGAACGGGGVKVN